MKRREWSEVGKGAVVLARIADATWSPMDSGLDVSCRANLQGANRFERGLVYASYLDTRYTAGEVIPDPFDPTSPAQLEERLRGLYYVLGQHPTYLMR